MNETKTTSMISIILIVDAGSSSIRCTAHEYRGLLKSQNKGIFPRLFVIDDDKVGDVVSTSTATPTTKSTNPPKLVEALRGIGHSVPLNAILPSTGHIRVYDVLDAIDNCVDETLKLLRRMVHPESTSSNSSSLSSSSTSTSSSCGGGVDYGHRVVAVGFSSFVMNLVAVDINGDPVGEVATCSYACNRPDVVMECERLRAELGSEKLDAMYQRTGAPLHVSYALPQLRAFYAKEENQHLAIKIDRWQTLSTICLHRWSGKPCLQMPISYSEASWTGMFDFRSCSWDQEALNLVETCPGVTQYDYTIEHDDDGPKDEIELLPPLVDFDSPLPVLREGIPPCNADGGLNPYWERWPEFRSHALSMFFGIGDGAAANVGSKCGSSDQQEREGRHIQRRIAVTIGTSAAARVCLPLSTPSLSSNLVLIPPGLFCYRVHRDTILLGGALTDGGCVVEWARSLLNLQSPESFDACMAQVSDIYEKRCGKRKRCDDDDDDANTSFNDHRVTMIPFLSGERSTGYRVGAKACISNLTRATSSNDVMYACLESVVLRLRRVLQLINEACREFFPAADDVKNVLIASGAALERNVLWRRMLADCSSADVIVDSDSAEEATSRGVAILLAESLQQTGLGVPRLRYGGITERTLVVADETRCNVEAAERWAVAASSQETLIDAIAFTWNS